MILVHKGSPEWIKARDSEKKVVMSIKGQSIQIEHDEDIYGLYWENGQLWNKGDRYQLQFFSDLIFSWEIK